MGAALVGGLEVNGMYLSLITRPQTLQNIAKKEGGAIASCFEEATGEKFHRGFIKNIVCSVDTRFCAMISIRGRKMQDSGSYFPKSDDDRILGFVCLERSWFLDSRVYLSMLVVSEKRIGLGTTLMKAAEAYAVAVCSATLIQLNVYLRAADWLHVDFYGKKLGYRRLVRGEFTRFSVWWDVEFAMVKVV